MTFDSITPTLAHLYSIMSRSRSRSRSQSKPQGEDVMDLEMDRVPSEDRVRDRPDEEEAPVK
jgi:hypothetical protein